VSLFLGLMGVDGVLRVHLLLRELSVLELGVLFLFSRWSGVLWVNLMLRKLSVLELGGVLFSRWSGVLWVHLLPSRLSILEWWWGCARWPGALIASACMADGRFNSIKVSVRVTSSVRIAGMAAAGGLGGTADGCFNSIKVSVRVTSSVRIAGMAAARLTVWGDGELICIIAGSFWNGGITRWLRRIANLIEYRRLCRLYLMFLNEMERVIYLGTMVALYD
jgi:hypothetical protein